MDRWRMNLWKLFLSLHFKEKQLELCERFEAVEDEYRKFDRVKNKRSKRADLHAFMLLDELFPNTKLGKIVTGARHDEIWLGVELEDIDKLTDDQIIELSRCGVMYDDECDCLSMFP